MNTEDFLKALYDAPTIDHKFKVIGEFCVGGLFEQKLEAIAEEVVDEVDKVVHDVEHPIETVKSMFETENDQPTAP